MKFTFKKLLLLIIISASIPLLLSHASQIYGSIYLATADLNQEYTTQIKDKLSTINKNKNDIEELILEVKSKKNDLSMEITPREYKYLVENKALNAEKEVLSLDEKNMKDLLSQFEVLRSDMIKHKNNKDYSTLLDDMNNLILLQKDKYALLKKVNLDLDNALGVLK